MENDHNQIAPPPSSAVTELLIAWGGGDDSALEQLMPLAGAPEPAARSGAQRRASPAV